VYEIILKVRLRLVRKLTATWFVRKISSNLCRWHSRCNEFIKN